MFFSIFSWKLNRPNILKLTYESIHTRPVSGIGIPLFKFIFKYSKSFFVFQRVAWKSQERTNTSAQWHQARSSANWQSYTTASEQPRSKPPRIVDYGPLNVNVSKRLWWGLVLSDRRNILISLRGKFNLLLFYFLNLWLTTNRYSYSYPYLLATWLSKRSYRWYYSLHVYHRSKIFLLRNEILL